MVVFLLMLPALFTGESMFSHIYLNQVDCASVEPATFETLEPYPLEGWMNDDGVNSYPESVVALFPWGKVFSGEGVPITGDNCVIGDCAVEWDISSQHSDWKPLREHSIFLRKEMPQLRIEKGEAALLATYFSRCYYHWMFELLPRIYMLKKAGVSLGRVVLPKIEYSFQRETLEHLGINEEQWFELDKDDYVQFEQLWVSSLPNSRFCTHPGWVIQFLRNSFLVDKFLVPHRHIFITRKKGTSRSARRLVNEEEVYEYLSNFGFERVVLEDMPFQEQVKLFESADVVVAVHGAGLTNLVFCNPGTKVIEISNKLHVNATYWYLSQQMGFNHMCLETPIDHLTESQKKSCDVYVPLGLLSDAAEKLGLTGK